MAASIHGVTVTALGERVFIDVLRLHQASPRRRDPNVLRPNCPLNGQLTVNRLADDDTSYRASGPKIQLLFGMGVDLQSSCCGVTPWPTCQLVTSIAFDLRSPRWRMETGRMRAASAWTQPQRQCALAVATRLLSWAPPWVLPSLQTQCTSYEGKYTPAATPSELCAAAGRSMADAHTSCALMAGLNENVHFAACVTDFCATGLPGLMDVQQDVLTDPNMPPGGATVVANITCTSDMMPNHTMLPDNGMAGRFSSTLKSYFDVATGGLLDRPVSHTPPPSLPPPPPRSPPALPPLPPQGPPLPTSPPFNPPQPPCSPPRHPTPLAGSPAMPSDTSATAVVGISAIINRDDPADVGEVIGQDDDDSEALLLGGDELQPYVLALSIGAPIALVAFWSHSSFGRTTPARWQRHDADMIPSPAPPRLLPPNPVHVDAVHRGAPCHRPRLPMPQFPSPSIRHAELTRSDSLERDQC